MNDEIVQISMTAGTRDECEKIGTMLLNERLVACFQMIELIKSSYWWEGRIEHAHECLCLLKTRKSYYSAIETFIKKHHSYKNPEIIAVPILHASDDYTKWIFEQTEIKK